MRVLRYLNDGTYVQMAIHAEGYCASAARAYNIHADNALKLSITSGISLIFTILGVAGITLLVATCAYFGTLYLPYYQERIESPLVITFVAGVIAFVIACIYLAMIDITSTSMLQCYLIDYEVGRGRVQFANERILEILVLD